MATLEKPPTIPGPAALDQLLAEHWWYHPMNLGHGRATPGQYYNNLIPVSYLMEHVDLEGMKCLDIGAMDGKMSFLMESLGGDVLAVDGVAKASMPAFIDAYGSTVRYRSGMILENLPRLIDEEGLFDFVLCAGVAYHVYSPFDLIANVRRLLKNRGIAIFETAAIPDDVNLTMRLNQGDLYGEHTTLWVPTTACFRYMLQYMSTRVLGEARLCVDGQSIDRHVWLVQAERPSCAASETVHPWLKALLGRRAPGIAHEFLKPQFDHDLFDATEESAIRVREVAENRTFQFENHDDYAAQTAFIGRGTPAWRLLP